MNSGRSYFALFGLPVAFEVDPKALDTAYRALLTQVHPDRFVQGTPAQKRMAMEQATEANEAYRTLKDPLERARYLCALADVPVDGNETTADTTFLQKQMQWRERLEEASEQGSAESLDALARELASERLRYHAALLEAFDRVHDAPRARTLVRELLFLERFAQAVDDAQYAMDASY